MIAHETSRGIEGGRGWKVFADIVLSLLSLNYFVGDGKLATFTKNDLENFLLRKKIARNFLSCEILQYLFFLDLYACEFFRRQGSTQQIRNRNQMTRLPSGVVFPISCFFF